MLKHTTSDQAYNYALSQLFGPSLLKKIQNSANENYIEALIKQSNLYPDNEDWNLIKGLELTYNYLKQNYRCEYIYKNEIANQLLLRYHGDNSATLLKEVASNSSIADIVIINGKTIAYEIKTELDSFDRLPAQLDSYRAMYDNVYIVTHPTAIKNLLKKVGEDIGIIVFDHDGVLRTVRKASENLHIFEPEKSILTLRQSELVVAYEKYVGKIPKMGTALIYNFCRNWYIGLDKADAHIVFLQALKSRKPSSLQFELIKQCSPALKMLFLGKEISKKNCISTINNICIS